MLGGMQGCALGILDHVCVGEGQFCKRACMVCIYPTPLSRWKSPKCLDTFVCAWSAVHTWVC